MFNKLKFNNLVISNKKLIQQGRVQTVQKCVQKIRKLKYLLEKQADNQKHKESLRRILLVMKELKALKRMEIVKNVLLLEKKPNAVLTNARAAVEETAAAMLALNSVIQKLIELIKSELQLNADDKSWCEALNESSRRRIKIARTEEKRRRRLEQKAQKALTRNRAEWLENQKNKNEGNKNTSVVITRNGVWKEETIGDAVTENIIPSVKNSTNTLEKVLKPKTEKQTKKTKTKLVQNYPKTEIKPFNDTPTKLNEVVKGSEKTERKKTVKHVVDPFFVTETGENYLATVGPNEPTAEEIEEAEAGKKSIVGLQRRRSHENNFNNNRQSFDSRKKSTITENSDYVKNNTQNLHPSWEAKQRRKPIVAPFQGKKIKFSDNQNEDKPALNAINSKNTTSELHPSWAAKQKLKPVITAFQGKKVVFDD